MDAQEQHSGLVLGGVGHRRPVPPSTTASSGERFGVTSTAVPALGDLDGDGGDAIVEVGERGIEGASGASRHGVADGPVQPFRRCIELLVRPVAHRHDHVGVEVAVLEGARMRIGQLEPGPAGGRDRARVDLAAG